MTIMFGGLAVLAVAAVVVAAAAIAIAWIVHEARQNRSQ